MIIYMHIYTIYVQYITIYYNLLQHAHTYTDICTHAYTQTHNYYSATYIKTIYLN